MKNPKTITTAYKDVEPSELAAVIGMLIVLITIGISWIIHSNSQSIKNYQSNQTNISNVQANTSQPKSF